MEYNTTYLIDINGKLVHRWVASSTAQGASFLLENGNLMRASKINGSTIQILDWGGNLVWDFKFSGAHHDLRVLPSGNVLLLVHDQHTRADAISAGRKPGFISGSTITADMLVEIQPTGLKTGTIVWQWRFWDHLIQDFDPSKTNFGPVTDHPELLDINYAISGNDDWLHSNSIDYNPSLDQVSVSCRHTGEVYIIDHGTTTAEATEHFGGKRGRGGDFLYRWGNPRVYRAGTTADQKLFGPHSVHWIDSGLPGAGHLLAFNNGWNRTPLFSSVDEIVTPISSGNYTWPSPGGSFLPYGPSWSYNATPPTAFFSAAKGGCQRLPNGNTLICESDGGIFFEIDTSKKVVWKYVNPVGYSGPVAQGTVPLVNDVFRCYRYEKNYSGLSGKTLIPLGTVEISEFGPGWVAAVSIAVLLIVTSSILRRKKRTELRR